MPLFNKLTLMKCKDFHILQQVAAPVPAMKEVLNNCMEAAKHWGLIEQNPGDYVYSRQ